jgi:hypothetical protein
MNILDGYHYQLERQDASSLTPYQVQARTKLTYPS